MKYIWVVDVNEEKAMEQGLTPADITEAIESLGDCFEVIEILQEKDMEDLELSE